MTSALRSTLLFTASERANARAGNGDIDAGEENAEDGGGATLSNICNVTGVCVLSLFAVLEGALDTFRVPGHVVLAERAL